MFFGSNSHSPSGNKGLESLFRALGGNIIPGAPSGIQPKFYVPDRDAARAPPPTLYTCDEERVKNYINKNLQTIPFWDAKTLQTKQLKQACNFLGIDTKAFTEKTEFVEAIDERRNKECAICISLFEKDEKVKVLLCGHLLHAECLHSFARTISSQNAMPRCPTCRTPLDAENKRARQVAKQNDEGDASRKKRKV